ncbi:unnamed protein product, partial [Adineta steineri]
KQAANQITTQVNQITSLLTSALNIHLNIGQNITMNTSSVIMSLETTSINSLSNKLVEPVGDAKIRLPSNFNINIQNNETISLRSIIQPLASSDQSQTQSYTNLSTSISLSLLDHNGNDISVHTNQSIEFIIPRDINLILPSMNLQNVTSLNHLLFNLHYVNITQSNIN